MQKIFGEEAFDEHCRSTWVSSHEYYFRSHEYALICCETESTLHGMKPDGYEELDDIEVWEHELTGKHPRCRLLASAALGKGSSEDSRPIVGGSLSS
eukprot:2232365-Amphidinium_carterae.2